MIPIMNNTRDQVIRIYPGERICQVVFQTISPEVTRKEAVQHGLAAAKYHDHGENFVSSKADRPDENEFIRTGKVDELKKCFKIA